MIIRQVNGFTVSAQNSPGIADICNISTITKYQGGTCCGSTLASNLRLLTIESFIKVFEGINESFGYTLIDITSCVSSVTMHVVIDLISEFCLKLFPEKVSAPVPTMTIDDCEERHLHALIQA
jgi:hypothetical protein